MALHPGEKGCCSKHGEYDEYCADCAAAELSEVGRKIFRDAGMPVRMTISEMREHLQRVDMAKDFLRKAVEAHIDFLVKQENLVTLLGHDVEGIWEETYVVIKRLSNVEQKITDDIVEHLMRYAEKRK